MDVKPVVDRVLAALGDGLDYAHPDRSFSPCYSDMGLGFTDEAGIACLYLHYNRRTSILGAPFLAAPGAAVRHERTALGVCQPFSRGQAEYAFYDRNAWVAEFAGLGEVTLHLVDDPQVLEGRASSRQGAYLGEGYLPTGDPRDPDELFPFVVGVRLVAGRHVGGDGLSEPLSFAPDDSGRLLLAFALNVLDVDVAAILALLRSAPDSAEAARAITYAWLAQALGELDCAADDPAEAKALAMAAFTLTFNACRAPGHLSGRIASFPSRGGYPTHFLWDTCFHNLALEHMDRQLAPDALLLLTENLRADGKMAHFLCSTWMRPRASQPPLVGWAALRLCRARDDRDLALELIPSLIQNTRWWLAQRMTRYGLIQCLDPLETGWDNSPRLDGGPVLACDMNSYLLLQMRAIAELSRMVGDREEAARWDARANAYAAVMVERLYDPQANLFREVLVETGAPLPIKTPACFLPLLAGVPLELRRARAMIEDYLLNPRHFFGAVPFPSVAYDEPTYEPANWWRGPTWLPVAYLMLEVLGKYGYAAERRDAAQRLYRMILKDGHIRELFNSQTGEGMGKYQQGWTAAILLRLRSELAAR